MTSAETTRTGCLVLIVGPSGSGKDTLIRAARARIEADSRYLFVRRVITRGKDEHEDHEEVSAEEFAARSVRGAFALSWSAHGLSYGVPNTVASAVEDGRTAICNVSRTVIETARSRFACVMVIEISAPAEVLALRLSRRARETVEDQAGRLHRIMPAPFRADVYIENSGTIEHGTALLIAAIERAAPPGHEHIERMD
jgi:ribose 1,5-bisphosphokinase